MTTRNHASRGAVSPPGPHPHGSNGDHAPSLEFIEADVLNLPPARSRPRHFGFIHDLQEAGERVHSRRVALFTGNYLHVTDGVTRTLRRLVAYLESRGHHVLVFGPSGPQASTCESYEAVTSIPMPGRPEYHLALGLPRLARKRLEGFSPELVHIATPDLMGIAALLWARAREVPVVATYHTHFPAYLRFYRLGMLSPPVRQYIRWFYGLCTSVCVPTSPLVGYFESLGIRRNVQLWGRGVDTREFDPLWRSEKWRSRHGLAPEDVVVSYVGRLVKEKSVDVFASVIERLRGAEVRVRSMVVGHGPLKTALKERLPETIFTGHLERCELSRAYASSDIFLFPSESEAFGNVIVEAMASGLPVVGAGSTATSSHIVDGRTGFVARPGDVEGFLQRILRLVVDREGRLRMGARAREHALTYDWSETLAQMARIYDEILEPKGHERP